MFGFTLHERTIQNSLCVQEVETIVKASVMTPDTRGQIHMVLGITQETSETLIQTPAQTMTEALKQDCPISAGRG